MTLAVLLMWMMMMMMTCTLQLDRDISAYTYEKTLAMEQRSAMLNMINKQRSGAASQRQLQHREQQYQQRDLPVLSSCLSNYTVTVTVTKVFILRFLLKDRKHITELFKYIQQSPG